MRGLGTRGTIVLGLALAPVHAHGQQACQPLQGTSAHATCLNENLSRTLDPDQTRTPPGVSPVAPALNLSRRDAPPVPAYSSDFGASQAAARQRMRQSTQSRSRALSGRVNRSLATGARRFGP